MKTKLQLIRPPLDNEYSDKQIQELMSVPIELCILASKLRNSIEVEVIDGMYSTIEEILSRIDADIVGVTDIYSFHQNSISVLKQAKLLGATTIIGGHNVNYLAGRILNNHPFVDYAIVGDGEEALDKLIKNAPVNSIPNLFYRQGAEIVHNTRIDSKLHNLFDLRNLHDLNNLDPNKPLPISSIRGCIKAQKSERCSFCSIDHELKIMNPEMVWKQIDRLHSMYGINYFFETGDTFIIGNYPGKLLQSRPDHLKHIQFKIYARPDQIDAKSIEILNELNVKEVFLGIDSINELILKNADKNYHKEDVEHAVNIILDRGMNLYVPFMYGLPGETLDTANENFEFAKRIAALNSGNLKILSSCAIPLPGTKLFEMILNNKAALNEYNGDLLKEDTLDYTELVKLLLKYYTSIDLSTTNNFINKTKNLISETNTTSFYIYNQKNQ